MSKIPDAWEDEWSAAADDPTPADTNQSKKTSSKVTKAQRRAQQAEFNRQLWAEAEGPRETNYFLESRNVVPLRSEFKPPPVLLSRKGPIIKSSQPPGAVLQDPRLNDEKLKSASAQDSSEDEDESKPRELTLAERQAQAAKDREEKQRRYEERRKELFGTSSTPTTSLTQQAGHFNRSGTSSPASLTPPSSRSATPSRARGGRGGRRGGAGGDHNTNSRNQSRGSSHQRELYDPSYGPKPEPTFVPRRDRENGVALSNTAMGLPQNQIQQPIRSPRGPDGSGRGGFGFTRSNVPAYQERDHTAISLSATTVDTIDAESSVPNGIPMTS